MFSPPIMTPWPAPPSSRPALLPDMAPPTIMPMPSSKSSSCWLCAVFRSLRRVAGCAPAIWPVSCAMMPMIWFGVSDCISASVCMKTLRPSITNALNESLWTMRMSMFCASRPAARKIGRE